MSKKYQSSQIAAAFLQKSNFQKFLEEELMSIHLYTFQMELTVMWYGQTFCPRRWKGVSRRIS